MGSKLRTSDSFNAAKNWLLNSGIQNFNKSGNINGGFNAWYDVQNKSYPFIYSEITGYGITTLLYLNKIKKEKIFIERAKLATNWLIERALHTTGGIKARDYYDKVNAPKSTSFEGGVIYAFDCGIVLNSLVCIFKETNNEKYLEIAEKIAKFLVEKLQKNNSLFFASYNTKLNKLIDSREKWSTQSGSYHAKLSLGFLKLYEETKNSKYRNVAIKICNRAMKFQKENGRFINFRDNEGTHLHPHLYTAEGLLYCGIKRSNSKFIESALKACQWSLKNQMKNGGIPALFMNGKFLPQERTDILAQTLRLSVILNNIGALKLSNLKIIEKLKNRLLNFQNFEFGPKNQFGGIFYGFDENGKKLLHLNSWCTMFTLQAIHMFHESLKKRRRVDIELFI